MGEKTPATQQQNSVTAPWAEAMPMLKNVMGKYGSINTDVTGQQTNALESLMQAAGSIPNFGQAGADAISKLFSSDPSSTNAALGGNLDALRANLGNTASGAELNPYDTPGFGDALGATMDDITNRVKGVYAASGRDPSGAGSFAGTLGKGLTTGVAPMLQSQYNTNKQNQMGAASTLYGAGNTTAQGQFGNQQTSQQNWLQGLTGAGALSGLFQQPATAQLGAANAAQNQAFANLDPMLKAALGFGGMGGSSSGTATQQAANDPLSNALGLGMMGAGLFFSDERLKEDIAPVGEMHDGQTVYAYRYKDDPRMQIGLLAQETLETKPEAVADVGGYLAVNYDKATAPSRRLAAAGALSDWSMAA